MRRTPAPNPRKTSSDRRRRMSDARCYTVPDLITKLQIPRASFYALKAQGRLPFLEELKPRLGRIRRYRADLVDRYLNGEYKAPLRKFKRTA
jgi:hypothetical protein